MNQMLATNMVKEYLWEIDNIYHEIKKVVEKLPDEQNLRDDLYKGGIIVMCIKYEAFTGDLFSKFFKDFNSLYNKPWSYTRQLAEKFNITFGDEYRIAKKCWEFYNTLKHINKNTMIERQKILDKYNVKNVGEAFGWTHKSLSGLIKKFLLCKSIADCTD